MKKVAGLFSGLYGRRQRPGAFVFYILRSWTLALIVMVLSVFAVRAIPLLGNYDNMGAFVAELTKASGMAFGILLLDMIVIFLLDMPRWALSSADYYIKDDAGDDEEVSPALARNMQELERDQPRAATRVISDLHGGMIGLAPVPWQYRTLVGRVASRASKALADVGYCEKKQPRWYSRWIRQARHVEFRTALARDWSSVLLRVNGRPAAVDLDVLADNAAVEALSVALNREVEALYFPTESELYYRIAL